MARDHTVRDDLPSNARHRRRCAHWWHAVVACGCLVMAGCTSVGVHTRERFAVDYGPPARLRVCVLRSEGVSQARIDKLIAAANAEFAPYGIEIAVPWVRPWTRSGFSSDSLFADVAARELEAPCDRLIAFVDRNAADFLWSLLMPEVLGAVDDVTHTRGFVVATQVSLNQLFVPPAKTTVHEFYHLLGCPHSGALTDCYERIAALKRERRPEADFFPGVSRDGRYLVNRESANARLRDALASNEE